MSSLRHVVKRSVHKERNSNPNGTGFVERKKDYLIRARDYHKKKDLVSVLEEKARQRNPDEFSHGMIRSKMDVSTGKHKKLISRASRGGELGVASNKIKKLILLNEESNKSISKEEAMRQQIFEDLSRDQQILAENTDLKFIETRLQMDRKKVEKMENSLHYIGLGGKSNRHVVMEDSDNEEADGAMKLKDSTDKKSKPSINKSEISQANSEDLTTAEKRLLREAEREKVRAYEQLAVRQDKENKLKEVQNVMLFRKHINEKGRQKMVIKGDKKEGTVQQLKFLPKRAK